jgi:tetratricopeptide (TPR) repeat protein
MPHGKIISKLWPLIIVAVALLQYANTWRHDYAWDDKLVITGNEYTRKGTAGLLEIFTKRVSVPYKNEYRPVPQSLFAIEYDVFKANPHVAHFFNTLWYALTCLIVYVFVGFCFPHFHKVFPFLVALLFAVHPLHVEVVANIKSRDEILSLLFGLASVMLLVLALERMSWRFLVAGLFAFVLAFLSKSNAVTLLPIVILVAWFRSHEVRPSRKLLITSMVIAACSVSLVILIRYLQNTTASDSSMQLNSTVLNNIFLWTTRPETITPTSLVIILRYIRLFLVPHPLIHLYGYNQIPLSTWGNVGPWVVVLGILTFAWIVIKRRQRKSLLVFGVLFSTITYSPYSNLFFYAPDTMADRYMFIPSVGLAILFVAALFRFAGLNFQLPDFRQIRLKVAFAVFALFLGALSVRTYIGNRDWHDDFTLIFNRIQYMENNAAAQAVYASMLQREGAELTAPELKQQKRVAAMKAYTRAIEIYPDFYWAWISIGKLFAEQKIYDKAELAFLRAQQIEPLGSEVYICLGTLHLAQQDPNVATLYLERAVLLNSEDEEAYVMLGKTYLQTNEIENLGSMVTTARKWFPDNVDLEALQATYYFRKQEYRQAVELARSVRSKDPGNILALVILSSPVAQQY